MNNLFNSIIKKFEDVVYVYDSLNFEVSEKKDELLIRDAQTLINREFNEDEKEAFLANPQQVIQDQMRNKLLDGAHTQLKNVVYDIEERYNDLRNLEKVIF